MKLKPPPTFAAAAVAILLAAASGQAHEHLEAGALSTTPGSPLVFANAGDYDSTSGYVFATDPGDSGSPYEGFYYTGDLVFAALAATSAFGGPEAGAAALGAHIEVILETVEGPAGASFSFWETAQNGVDSTNLTWSVPVGLTNGTHQIVVTEAVPAPGADPYGHIHGRIYSVDRPGLYQVGFRFVDTSTFGPGGESIHTPSDRFILSFQADVTLAKIRPSAGGVDLTFAAPSNLPDDGSGAATNYQLESSAVLGGGADWRAIGALVVGDDHLHTITVPVIGSAAFFRLKTS